MNSTAYFDLCAIILYAGLFGSITNRHLAVGKANRILQVELIIGGVASIFSFLISFIAAYFPQNQASVIFLTICKYLQVILQLLLINFNSLYQYVYLGIQEMVFRLKPFFIFCLALFIIPLIAIILNIPLDYLFFVTPTLNIGTSPYFLILYIVYIIVLLKDVVLIICCNKLIVNKTYFFAIVLLVVNAFFLVCQCILPEWKQSLFVFAISMYILVSYMQRPDLMINPLFNAMSKQAFYISCTRNLTVKNKTVVALIKISNYKNLQMYVGQQSYLECIKIISAKIKYNLEKGKLYGDVFYLEHGVFAITINSKLTDKLRRFFFDINRIFQQEIRVNKFNILCEAKMCVVSLPDEIENIEYFREFSKIFDHVIPKQDSVVYFSDICEDKEFQFKNKLKDVVERAISDNHLVVYYQPIYGVKEGRYISAEALVRIDDPEFGVISPSVFIPYAEQNDYIHKIGDFVFESVCKFIASDEFKTSGLKYVEMNLSTAQCLEENFVNKISGIMQRYKVTSEEIRFEITEETADLHPAIVEQSIKSIHDMGIVFALDGYGTGYSNIKKFNTLPFDVVKLDQSFVSKSSDEQIKMVIGDTIKMFKKLGKQVLVEGIESKELEEVYKNIDCDFVQGCEFLQGYFYSKPMPQKEFLEFINKGK